MVTEQALRVNFHAENGRRARVGHRGVRVRLLANLGAAALALAACSGGLRNGVFVKEGVRYELGAPPDTWRKVELAENDLAFVAPTSAHSLAVNSTCHDFGDASLEVLTSHLLIGFTDRVKVSEEPGTLDGRASLSSRYLARLDGVEVELALVVMKKDGCAYDFTYVAPHGRFDEQATTFQALLARFKTGARR